MDVKVEYEKWLNSKAVSEEEKEILKSMSEEEIDDAFYKDIEFGTAGMRGILGLGNNRMNIYTVRHATVAFAKYLLEIDENATTKGVVIAHDNRYFSREFTLETARVLNLYGIKAYLFDSLRPTPELSYAVRYLKAAAGIVITASHNPKEYNGYKVYDENGCQLVPSKIARLLEIIESIDDKLDLVLPESGEGQTIVLDDDVDEAYCKDVLSIRLNPNLDKSNYKIVYSPQHGTSFVNAMKIFKMAGYEIVPVESQCSPDPDFSGTLSPNPEDKKAYVAAIELALKVGAPLIVTTDPDADRVGVAYLSSKGTYEYLNGNDSGALLIEYIFSQRQKQGTLSQNGVMFNTVVTSSFGKDVASYYGVKTESLLTGFKFIGDRVHDYEISKEATYEFGYEESYGSLIAPFVRDKDGLQALLMIAELAVYYHNEGKTIDQALDSLYVKLGRYYRDTQYSKFFKGASGARDMGNLMSSLRNLPIKEIGGLKVVRFEDYLTSEAKDEKSITSINLPKSNVVKFILENDSFIAVRPSGTEPKCKFYICAVGSSKEEAESLPLKLFEDFSRILGL